MSLTLLETLKTGFVASRPICVIVWICSLAYRDVVFSLVLVDAKFKPVYKMLVLIAKRTAKAHRACIYAQSHTEYLLLAHTHR